MKQIEDKLFLNRYLPNHAPHMKIMDNHVCRKDCSDKPCTIFCPSKVYGWDPEENRIVTAYEGCVECGTCRYGCPYDNIDWRNPRGGFGIAYKFG